jgi:neutral ceramidase
MTPTAHAGEMVVEAPLQAGIGEAVIDLPVGSVQGGYQARTRSAGMRGMVDARDVPSSDAYMPSVGIETRPRARALALRAGTENVVIIKMDLPLGYDTFTFDVERALGSEFAGKVIVATSHSHGAMAQFTPNPILQIGLGRYHYRNYERVLAAAVSAARTAVMSLQSARIGFATDTRFDPSNMVSHDRRPENNMLAGRERKDENLYVIRVDTADGQPLALLNVFGVHGTVLGPENLLATNEVTGAVERALEESFDPRRDGRPVLVMHLQGAGGDVSPSAPRMIDCAGLIQCQDFATMELVGRAATQLIKPVWTMAGAAMRDSLAIEAVTRSVPLGPDWNTFAIRAGAQRLEYAPFLRRRLADARVYGAMGELLSPIDEFNAWHGAGLCGAETGPLIPMAALPGVASVRGYRSCIDVQRGAELIFGFASIDPEPTPVCASTKTVVSAVRLGEYMLATLPGEPVTLLADSLRRRSPVSAERTIVVGYSQGHMGYLLTPEDWLLGGYEPSINLWGPLEGEYIAERAAEVLAMAATPVRENAAMGSMRLSSPMPVDDLPAPDQPGNAGTVPQVVPPEIWVRGRRALPTAQPPAMVSRLELAHFVFAGDDPFRQTPRVRLERETAAGSNMFVPVTRRSSRQVTDGDMVLTYAPSPLRIMPGVNRSHYWAVEWQAVPPTVDAEAGLSDRANIALGRYRFHVEGAGWMLNSTPFAVVEATLAVTAQHDGANVRISVGYESRSGWRLIDRVGPVNRRVPLRSGTVRVVSTVMGAMPVTDPAVSVDGNGVAVTTASGQAMRVTRVEVQDAFGNRGTADVL